MNFAIPFSRNFKYADQQNIQWNINYKPKIKQLNDFIQTYRSYRINLIITDFKIESDCSIIQTLIKKFPETKIISCLPRYSKQLENKLNQLEIPHYYNEFVTDWDKFQGFLKLNVTDIFVAENLMFNVKILSTAAKKNNKSLRSFCNVCESSWLETPSIKTFFIRPEDLKLYEKYIDTFEFYINNASASRLNTLYEIYVKDQKWFGKLEEIIVGYVGEEDNRFFIPNNFGEKRLNCSKKCMQDNEKCNICNRIVQLSHTLKDKKVMIVQNV